MKYLSEWFHDVRNLFHNELRLVLHDSGVMIIFCFAGLVYPLLYNWIYSVGTVDDMPVAVVDLSHGSYSRQYVRELDATRECAVAYDCTSMEEARSLMTKGKAHGIVYIPADFDRRIVSGEQGVISTYADMSTFLYYKSLTIGTSLVMLDQVHQIQTQRYAASGFTGQDALQLVQPVQYDDVRLYNPNISFTMFFLFMTVFVILQQVLFYGSSMLAGTLREEGRSFARLTDNLSGFGVGRVVLGRGAAYYLIFLLLGMYGALLIPRLFHMPQHCMPGEMVVLLLFFLADIIFFSFTWSSLINRRETVLVLWLCITPLVVFLTGFAWPREQFPAFWRVVSYIFPTTFGVRAYMNLCDAGSLSAIRPEIVALTVQTMVYYVLASAAIYIENAWSKRRQAAAES